MPLYSPLMVSKSFIYTSPVATDSSLPSTPITTTSNDKNTFDQIDRNSSSIQKPATRFNNRESFKSKASSNEEDDTNSICTSTKLPSLSPASISPNHLPNIQATFAVDRSNSSIQDTAIHKDTSITKSSNQCNRSPVPHKLSVGPHIDPRHSRLLLMASRKNSSLPTDLDTFISNAEQLEEKDKVVQQRTGDNEWAESNKDNDIHSDDSSTCLPEHSIIDLTTHSSASRTSSSDSNQSDCSTFWRVTPKVSTLPTVVNIAPKPEEALTENDFKYYDQSSDTDTSKVPNDLVGVASLSSTPSSSCGLQWIKSDSIHGNDDDTILTVSCFSDSVCDMDVPVPLSPDPTGIGGDPVPQDLGSDPLSPDPTGIGDDPLSPDPSIEIDSTDDETSTSSMCSLYSVLASLEQSCDHRKKFGSYSYTPPTRGGYSSVFNLPAGPANALRRSFKKSHSFSPTANSKKLVSQPN